MFSYEVLSMERNEVLKLALEAESYIRMLEYMASNDQIDTICDRETIETLLISTTHSNIRQIIEISE